LQSTDWTDKKRSFQNDCPADRRSAPGVRFNLIDKIVSIDERRVVAVKQVSLAEEYLADHFPTFPVLPGVMMLETLVQAAGWLMHARSDFACSMAVLKEVRNVKYGRFVAPGEALRVEVESADKPATFKAAGRVDGRQAVAARLELAYFNLADRRPSLAPIDRRLIEHHRRRWALIAPNDATAADMTANPMEGATQ